MMEKTNYNEANMLIIHTDDSKYPWETDEFGESLRRASEAAKRGEFLTPQEAYDNCTKILDKKFGTPAGR
jgi:hypothetical protein